MALFTKKYGEWWLNPPAKRRKKNMARKRKRVYRRKNVFENFLENLRRRQRRNLLENILENEPARRYRFRRNWIENIFENEPGRKRSRYRRNPIGDKAIMKKVGYTAVGIASPLVLSSVIPIKFAKRWQNIGLGIGYAGLTYALGRYVIGLDKRYVSYVLYGGIAGAIFNEMRDVILQNALTEALKKQFQAPAPAPVALPEASKASAGLYYQGELPTAKQLEDLISVPALNTGYYNL